MFQLLQLLPCPAEVRLDCHQLSGSPCCSFVVHRAVSQVCLPLCLLASLLASRLVNLLVTRLLFAIVDGCRMARAIGGGALARCVSMAGIAACVCSDLIISGNGLVVLGCWLGACKMVTAMCRLISILKPTPTLYRSEEPYSGFALVNLTLQTPAAPQRACCGRGVLPHSARSPAPLPHLF